MHARWVEELGGAHIPRWQCAEFRRCRLQDHLPSSATSATRGQVWGDYIATLSNPDFLTLQDRIAESCDCRDRAAGSMPPSIRGIPVVGSIERPRPRGESATKAMPYVWTWVLTARDRDRPLQSLLHACARYRPRLSACQQPACLDTTPPKFSWGWVERAATRPRDRSSPWRGAPFSCDPRGPVGASRCGICALWLVAQATNSAIAELHGGDRPQSELRLRAHDPAFDLRLWRSSPRTASITSPSPTRLSPRDFATSRQFRDGRHVPLRCRAIRRGRLPWNSGAVRAPPAFRRRVADAHLLQPGMAGKLEDRPGRRSPGNKRTCNPASPSTGSSATTASCARKTAGAISKGCGGRD